MIQSLMRSGGKALLVLILAILAFSSAMALCIARDCICIVRPIDTLAIQSSNAGYPIINPATGLLYVSVNDALEIAVYDTAQLGDAPLYAPPLARVPTFGYVGGNLAVDERANKIYMSQGFAQRVRVIDGDTHDYHDIPVPDLVNALGHPVVDPERLRLYVLRSDNLDIAVFDTVTEAFLGTIGQGCCDTPSVMLAIDAQSGLLWVLNQGDPARLTVWTGDGRQVAQVPVGSGSNTLALAPRIGRAFVTRPRELSVAVIDMTPGSPTAYTVVDEIGIKETPGSIAVDPDAMLAYTGNGSPSGTLSILDLSLMRHVMDRWIGHDASLMTLDPMTSRIYLMAGNQYISVVQSCPVPRNARADADQRSRRAAARRATRIAQARPSPTPDATDAAERRELVRCNRMFRIRTNCHPGPDLRESALVHATVEAAGAVIVDGGASGQLCGLTREQSTEEELVAAGAYYSLPVVERGAAEPVIWTFGSSTLTFGQNAVPADTVITRMATPPAAPWAEALWYLSRRKLGAPDAMCEHLPPTLTPWPVRAGGGAGR